MGPAVQVTAMYADLIHSMRLVDTPECTLEETRQATGLIAHVVKGLGSIVLDTVFLSLIHISEPTRPY